jgi:hypothetical protein
MGRNRPDDRIRAGLPVAGNPGFPPPRHRRHPAGRRRSIRRVRATGVAVRQRCGVRPDPPVRPLVRHWLTGAGHGRAGRLPPSSPKPGPGTRPGASPPPCPACPSWSWAWAPPSPTSSAPTHTTPAGPPTQGSLPPVRCTAAFLGGTTLPRRSSLTGWPRQPRLQAHLAHSRHPRLEHRPRRTSTHPAAPARQPDSARRLPTRGTYRVETRVILTAFHSSGRPEGSHAVRHRIRGDRLLTRGCFTCPGASYSPLPGCSCGDRFSGEPALICLLWNVKCCVG